MNDKIRKNLESGHRCRQWNAEGGTTDEALIESYGAPVKWPQEVTIAADAFEAAFGQQDSAVSAAALPKTPKSTTKWPR